MFYTISNTWRIDLYRYNNWNQEGKKKRNISMLFYHWSIQYRNNKFFRLTPARRTICILRFAVVAHLDMPYNSNGRRNSCKYADKGRKSVAKVVPRSNTRRRTGTRSACLEAVTDSDRICSDLLWGRHKFRKTSDRPCTDCSHNTGPRCSCCDSRARIALFCSSSSPQCN